jgi:acyl-coenzyme A synthetase/AMP-(fatty) acid ligase
VKIDGHRVELGEIEHAVRSATGRSTAAVLAIPEGPSTTLVLFVELPEVDVDALVAELKARLPAYMLPRHVRHLDKLPLNANGKLDRPRMREIYLQHRA